MQCEKLLGLAGGNTKKHGNKKSGESRTRVFVLVLKDVAKVGQTHCVRKNEEQLTLLNLKISLGI